MVQRVPMEDILSEREKEDEVGDDDEQVITEKFGEMRNDFHLWMVL